MPNEIIGGISVAINVDLSALQAQFTQAQTMAQAAGQTLANGFSSAAPVFANLGAAAEQASGKVDGLASSLGDAASGLAAAGATLSVISVGLGEIATSSLEAYSNLQRATLALEALTGSATQAKSEIADLKTLAQDEGLSFPELLQANQRLTALGVSATQIPAALRASADAAAAMNTSLINVTNAIDRMAASGSVAGRNLTQLGLTTNILAETMGVSLGSLSKAFHNLDESDRIDALTQALGKFSGEAEKVASGVTGSFNRLENAVTFTLQAIGEDLGPVASKLSSFAITLLGQVENLAKAFGQLPVPVQATVLGLTAIVAAIGPLLLGLAGISFAVKSLVELPAAITALGSAMGLMGANTAAAGVAAAAAVPAVEELAVSEAAVAESAVAANFQLNLFQEELSAAAAEATVAGTQLGLLGEEIGAIAVTSAESGTAMAAAAAGGMSTMSIASAALVYSLGAIIGYKLGGWAYEQVPGLKALADNFTSFAFVMIPGYQAAMEKLLGTHLDLNRDMEGTGEAIKNLQAQLATLHVTVDQGTMSEEQYIAALTKARDAHKDQDVSISAEQKALLALQDTYASLQDNLTKAQGVLALARQGMDDGSVSAGEYQLALKAVDDAQKKLAAGSKDYQDTLAGLTENYNKQQGTIDTLEQTIGQLLAVQDRTAAQDTILAEATTKLTGLLKQQADAHGLVAAAAQGQGKAYDGLVKSVDALMTKAIASNVAVTQAKAVLDQLTASEDTSAEHQRAVIAAMEQYKTSLETAGVSTNGFIQVTVNGAKTMVNLGQALKEAKDHAADFVTTTATVPQVVETATGRLNGMVIPLGFIATGLDSIVTIINNKAIPAIKTFTDLHPQLASGLDFATASLKKMNDETEQSIINAGQAIGSQSSYVGALDHTDDAISGTVDNMSRFAASINDATAAGTGFVDHSSAFANSIDKIGASAAKSASAVAAVVKQTNGSLSQFVSDTQVGLNGTNGSLSQFVSDTKSSMGQAQESFKATTGEVNALSIGVKFLAMQMSGLTVFAGSGGIINQNQNPGDLQHQLWLAQNAAGDPAGANGLISILPKVTAALKDQTAATDALAKSSTAAAAATIQYVDGVGNIYDSYQQMVDAVNKNPALGGLWHTITKSMTDLASVPIQSLSGNLDSVSTGLNNLGTAVGTAAQGISTGVQSLSTAQQAAVDYQRVITDTIGSTGEDFARSSNGWAQSADEITARMAADAASMQEILSRDYNAGAHSSDGGGQPGLPSGQITDKNTGKVYPDFATYLAAQLVPAMATNEGAGPQAGLPTGPITDKNSGKVYSDFASYLAAQLPSTAPVTESTGSNPYDYFSRPPASVLPNNPNLATVTSNQQSGPNGAGVTLNIINPVVTSQSQAEMVLSQAINYLRNTAGLKL